MLRVTPSSHDQSGRTLKLEGKLVEPWVAEVRELLESTVMAAPVSLDVSSLSYVDDAGVEFLHQLVRRGFQLVGTTPYVAQLLRLRRERSDS